MYAHRKYEYHKGESVVSFKNGCCLIQKQKKGSMQPEQEAFMGHLIIDDTTIYEMDEECLRQKERKEKDLKSANVESWESKASHTDKGKERPAP